MVRRAGLSTDAEMIDGIGTDIRDVQTTPGRLTQPVESASRDAWIKYYRPDENTPNTAISYYTKGAVIAFVLDGKIRQATDGARSLDDVMRLAYARYAGETGYTDAGFKAVVHEVAGRDFGAWWTSVLQTTDELAYDEPLHWLGLRFRPVDQSPGSGSGKTWLGVTAKNDAGRLVVSQVRRGTPAHKAGVNVDDEILAIDEFRVRPDGLDRRLEQYAPGRAVTLLVARRDELLRIPVTLGREPADTWRLEPRPDATPEQQARRKAWMGEASTSSGTP
jgi:predicted metalloprotease with PDZ domain